MKQSYFDMSGPLRGRHSIRIVVRFIGLLVVVLLSSVATAQAAEYGFTLGPPNTAMNPGSGETIRVTGSGTFDTTLGSVLGGGSYSIRDAAGDVIERGIWAATDFLGFAAQGGPNPGLQGGVLDITIVLYPRDGAPITAVPMTIVCPFEEDEGTFDEEEDGTTVDAFTQITGGITVFHLIEP